jgi:UDP-N-acetylmuramoyl-tripeptide--D-alanyl-D-alanine ligase
VARAKGEIFAGLGEQGAAVINVDDDYASLWRTMAEGHQVLSFAIDHSADVNATWRISGFGSHIEVRTPFESFSADLQVPGEHNVRNALAATTAALALHVTSEKIATGLNRFEGVAGRMQRKSARQGAVVIDDTYNANPASLHAAMAVLAQVPGKKILVLGDMGELGPDAAHFHAEIGAEARSLGIQTLLTLGDLSTYAVDEFGLGAQHFKRIEDLIEELETQLDPDCTVLVKGSRFMRMERVVQHCTALQ